MELFDSIAVHCAYSVLSSRNISPDGHALWRMIMLKRTQNGAVRHY